MEKALEQINDKEIMPQLLDHKNGIIGYMGNVIREIISITFWSYALIKLFIYDIDTFLIGKYLPAHSWLLNLKFFIIIGLLAVIWLITKNKYILSWSAYILFYPLIILLWKIPFFVFKQQNWVLTFAFINAIISFFRSIKYNFITSALFLVSLAIVFSFSDERLLWFAVTVILVLLIITYVSRFILVFKPSSIFQIHIKIFSAIRKHGTSSFSLDENIKNLPLESLDQKQLEKWITNLQMSVLFNRLCLFAARKLTDYQNSGLNVISYVLTILLLVILTIISFASINYGLYKIGSNFFEFNSIPTFFTFFYYSFNNLLFNSVQELTPIAQMSQSMSMVESFFSLFLIAIFVSLLLSVRSQRHTEELKDVIKGIEEEGRSMEQFIKTEYKFKNIEDAIAELEKLKAGLINFIYQISKNI